MNKEIDQDVIEQFFNEYIKYPGACAEVRIFQAYPDRTNHISRNDKIPTVCGGWFDYADSLSAELTRLQEVSAYITVNPVALTNRPIHAYNRLKLLKKGEFATDKDILKIRYAIIDIDPISKQGRTQNSTNRELFECITIRDRIVREEKINGSCITGISGNGAFAVIRIDERDNTPDCINDLNDMFVYFDSKYSNEFCKIDINTINPSRHIAIPGTWKFRDPLSTAERPHRRVELQWVADDGMEEISPS